ncbi:MAG: phenylalanine--tRNA ligase subunit alpha [Candidatus Margulisbacteria bacterium]|nr:phenylalanine--tRNA ligase subunit alpha [Candidatus Margulisiibacteriota bacterium]
MEEKLELLAEEANSLLNKAKTSQEVEDVRVSLLGKKGKLTEILKGISQLNPEERPKIGQLTNDIKVIITQKIEDRKVELVNQEEKKKIFKETIDITLPGKKIEYGHKHLVIETMQEIINNFRALGYSVAEGPEVETDYYNFEALNMPADHAAREMWDTLYLKENYLLRTHTSPVQIRLMQSKQPPIKAIMPGKVYRRDNDVTHSPVFHQVEGLLVDRDITFADLKGTLEIFVHQMFGKDRPVRFRPSFFPFTEPSAEIDVQCILCNGAGCSLCKGTGWIEILGAGMVDPNVFEAVTYDPNEYTGFAFGLGVERVAMLRHGINNIRLFYEGDLRFSKQF